MVKRAKVAKATIVVDGCSSLNIVRLFGKVISGKGEGRKYVELIWVQRQIKENLGFKAFPGTLNLCLDAASTRTRELLDEKATSDNCHSRGYCVGLLFKASIAGLTCGVVIPQVESYPKNLLEMIAPINLRQDLRLHDGDSVEIEVLLRDPVVASD